MRLESGYGDGHRQRRQRQEELWVARAALPRAASHPFYERLNRLLDECQFDGFVESLCKPFYARTLGRPGLAPGIYFRLLMVGYFEGIDSERGMAWRAADSLGIRAFLRNALDEDAPDHSTMSRTRRLIDVETHRLVFVWLLEILAEHGLLRGRTIGIDATTLEANAALRTIVRRDSGSNTMSSCGAWRRNRGSKRRRVRNWRNSTGSVPRKGRMKTGDIPTIRMLGLQR